MNPEDMSGGTGKPGGDQIPEVWIGQQVTILIDGTMEAFNGPLVEVNDRGVAIRYFQKSDGSEGPGEEEQFYAIYFFPWHRVRVVARREDEA